MRNIQEVKWSNEFVERFPQGVAGNAAANFFCGLLNVMFHFYKPHAYLIAPGSSDTAAVTVKLYDFTSGNVLLFAL